VDQGECPTDLRIDERPFVEGALKAPPVTVRDPDDAVILGEALAGRADVLVTKGKDLLVLDRVGRYESWIREASGSSFVVLVREGFRAARARLPHNRRFPRGADDDRAASASARVSSPASRVWFWHSPSIQHSS
jgi:hypothetical protein